MQLWKYVPTNLYKTFAKNESIAYDIILEIIVEDLYNEHVENRKCLLSMILEAEGLDILDKISGLVGALQMF